MVKFIVYYTILKNLYLSNVGVVTEKLICGLRVSLNHPMLSIAEE